MYYSGNGNDAATVERGRKRPTASCKKSDIPVEAAINSRKKIPESHDPSEEQEKSSSRSSNQSVKFQKRIEELRAFKAKFGHCNVRVSKSASNKPYVSLGHWCCQIRYTRRLIEGERPGILKLCKAQIEILDALGFQWEVASPSFDNRIEELWAFKAKFGHCNVTQSNSTSNKPYMSLGTWCGQVRSSRRLIEEGKEGD